MKKHITILFILFFAINNSYTQTLQVNVVGGIESNYSLQELVENVLISGACAQVDTFSEQSFGQPFDQQTKSYGFFKRPPGNTFPFETGIILTTGLAYPAGNGIVVNTISNSNGQGGDSDLANALNQTGLQDATYVKFTFVPMTDTLSFRFIMASEEYNHNFECNYADSFAFLLREEGTTTYTNLAVLPDGTPVTVTNINSYVVCAANEEYFEGYNVGNTNYGGRTKALIATSAVTPGVRYEIKLVVADQGDSALDSAIFLEAGSFELGANLGEPYLSATNTAVCGDEVLLDANIIATSYKWYRNNTLLVGETNQTYLANLGSATYKVEVELSLGCYGDDEIEVNMVTPSTINSIINNYIECDSDGDGISTFDLTSIEAEILNGQSNVDYAVEFYLDNMFTVPVPDPTAFDSSGQTIFTRVVSTISNNCYADGIFQVVPSAAQAADPADIPNLRYCDNDSFGTFYDNKIAFDLELNEYFILNGFNSAAYDITYFIDAAYTNQIPVANQSNYVNTSNLQTIYVQMTSVTDATCYDRTSFEIEVYPYPEVTEITTGQCDDNADGTATLNLTLTNDAITPNAANEAISFYTTEALANSNTNPITDFTSFTTATTTIWVRVENQNCFDVKPFHIIITSPPISYNNTLYACDDFIDTVSNPTDGTSVFDLTNVEVDLLNLFPVVDQPSLSFSYYQNFTDAQSQQNEITNPTTFRNTTINNQRIFIRINSDLLCAGLGSDLYVDLSVEALPVIVQPANLRGCNLGNNEAFFDTTTLENEILNGQTGITLSFYDENNILIPTANFYPSYQSVAQIIKVVAINALSNVTTPCFSETTVTLIIDEIPSANAVPIQELCDDNPDTTDGISVFNTAHIEPTIIGTQTNVAVHYYTNYYDVALKEEILPTLPQNYSTGSSIVTAEVVNLDNPSCNAITDIEFYITPDAPYFEISDQLLCLNQSPLTVIVENPLAIYDYQWEDKYGNIVSITDSAQIVNGGEYTVTATSAAVCSTTITFFVTESSIPKIETVTIFDDSANNRFSVLVSGAGDYEFALDDGDFEDGNELYGHVFYNVPEGLHTFHINDKNGCTPIISQEVIIIRFPKFITPNHDGINDTFSVYGGDAFVKSNVSIFNRYGKLIKVLDNNDDWNGFYLDKVAVETDYWFLAKFTDTLGKEYERKGHFSLKR